MTFEDLLDILAEQFSCDAAELSEDTSFEDLGVDAEDLVELAWQLGEATGTEVEADLKAQKVAAKDIKLYIKPQDGACYYVADGKVAGRVDLF